jgi:hypothetical protein
MVGLSATAPEREVKVLGQILIVNPPITGSPVGFGERPPIPVAGDGDATFVDGGVMPLTEQHQIASTALCVPSVGRAETASNPHFCGPGSRSHRSPGPR